MSNIAELQNVPEVSFIEHMTLQETERQVREIYIRIYKERTGKEPTLAPADPVTLLIKAFAMVEYQTMQYIEAKGAAELLKTATGANLDNLVALLGITRQEATRATASVRFTLSAERAQVTAIPAGTRVKTMGGKYFNTVDYAEIPTGELTAETIVRAEETGAESNGCSIGEIDTLVDPIPYVASVENTTESTGGADIEGDDSLTKRAYLAPSKYSVAGPRDAYAYYVQEWRSDLEDVQIITPSACVVEIYFVMQGGRLPNETEKESLREYISGETLRPLCDQVFCLSPEEVEYSINATYWIGRSQQKSAGTIQEQVNRAIEDFQVWQRKLGRDVNPSELIARIRDAGAKRVRLTLPEDVVIGKTQLPKCADVAIVYGGLEDD